MAVFASTDKMYDVLGTLFRTLTADESLKAKLGDAGISMRYIISNPQGEIWVMPDGEVICGSHDAKATVEMILDGDTCHKFWLQQIKMPVALAKGLIKAKGPLPQVLKLLPMLKPAYQAYPDIARANGLEI